MNPTQEMIEAAARAIYEEWRSPDYFTWEQAVEGRNANPDPTFPHIVDKFRAQASAALTAALAAAPASAEPELTETCFGLALSADDLYNVVSVSLDEADPEELQQWIPGRAVVQRTVSYSAWTLRDAPKSADPAAYAEPSEDERECSCPSGDGSLRWPCRVHPPQPAEQTDSEREMVDEWCYNEHCEFRHWRSGSMPTHKHRNPAPVSRDAELIAEAKRWVKLHKRNPYQEAAAKLMSRLVEHIEAVTK